MCQIDPVVWALFLIASIYLPTTTQFSCLQVCAWGIKKHTDRSLLRKKWCPDMGLIQCSNFLAHGFNRTALQHVHSYLTERQQRVKINGSLSTLKCSTLGVPQASVLGPLLFNIYINDFFYLVKDTEVCNYADDTTIFVCGTELDPILKSVEKDVSLLSSWFANNYMKMNGDKSHLLMLGKKALKQL